MVAAIFIMGASYAGCNKTLVVLFFTITVTSQNLATPGSYVNPMDLSQNYIGPLSAIVNGVSSLSGMLSPYVIGLMTPNVSKMTLFQMSMGPHSFILIRTCTDIKFFKSKLIWT